MGVRPDAAHTESLTIPPAVCTARLSHTVSRTAFGKPDTRIRLPLGAAVVVLGMGRIQSGRSYPVNLFS
jgi:hypothetical protein